MKAMIETLLIEKERKAMQELLFRELIDDGQRNYRLRNEVNSCPKFDNPIHIAAWKTGYYSARDKVSVDAALATFIKEQSDNFQTGE